MSSLGQVRQIRSGLTQIWHREGYHVIPGLCVAEAQTWVQDGTVQGGLLS